MIDRYVIASIDLDESRCARLEMACDRVDDRRVNLELHRWSGGPPAQMLIVGAETNASRIAVDVALGYGIPVVRIGHLPWDPGAVFSLDVHVEASELSIHLLERLDAVANAVPAVVARLGPPPFLTQILSSSGGIRLLERGLFRVIVGLVVDKVLMLRRMPYSALVVEAMAPIWFVTQLSPRRYAEEFEQDVTISVPLETLLWDIAIAYGDPIVEVSIEQRLSMRAWPVPSSNQLPPHWLLPLGCLFSRSWLLPDLAQATVTSAVELERIYAVVAASGLADVDILGPVARRGYGVEEPSMLRRLARRFRLILERKP